jgi:hypothetical protein
MCHGKNSCEQRTLAARVVDYGSARCEAWVRRASARAIVRLGAHPRAVRSELTH